MVNIQMVYLINKNFNPRLIPLDVCKHFRSIDSEKQNPFS